MNIYFLIIVIFYILDLMVVLEKNGETYDFFLALMAKFIYLLLIICAIATGF